MSSRVTAGMIWGMVADALRWTDQSDLNRLHDPTTMAYWDLCELAPFPLIRRNKSLTFSGSAIQLPLDTIDAYSVEDSSGNPYRRIEQEDLVATNGRKRWYYSAVADGTDLTGSPYIQIVGTNGVPESATVTVRYWVYPPTLDKDSDLILLPASRALVLKTAQYMLTFVDHDPDIGERINAEYPAAKEDLLSKISLPGRFQGGRR